jgi:DNA-binding response OmpR family regulator
MTYSPKPQILIVDDDEAICKTLSAILKAKGYQTITATTAKEAIEKAKAQLFNIALLDIKLPDMEGTQLLAQLQEITPETIKIMVTGYPSLKNAVDALNYGADSYVMKPIDPSELLETLKNKLQAQREAEEFTKERLAEWVQSQTRKAQASDFQEFLEETSNELACYGLTKTQAKIYIAITALGIASASETAKLAKIRREEVYRMIPELEKHGIVTRRLEVPRKFSAARPEIAIQMLTKAKLAKMKEEAEKLEQKQTELLTKLKATTLPTKQEGHTIEVIPQKTNINARLANMAENANRQIEMIFPVRDLLLVFAHYPQKAQQKMQPINIRIMTENHKQRTFGKKIMQLTKGDQNTVMLRQIGKLPYNLLAIDGKEAIWKGNQLMNEDTSIFWTTDPTQMTILKTSFENLWQKSQEWQSEISSRRRRLDS